MKVIFFQSELVMNRVYTLEDIRTLLTLRQPAYAEAAARLLPNDAEPGKVVSPGVAFRAYVRTRTACRVADEVVAAMLASWFTADGQPVYGRPDVDDCHALAFVCAVYERCLMVNVTNDTGLDVITSMNELDITNEHSHLIASSTARRIQMDHLLHDLLGVVLDRVRNYAAIGSLELAFEFVLREYVLEFDPSDFVQDLWHAYRNKPESVIGELVVRLVDTWLVHSFKWVYEPRDAHAWPSAEMRGSQFDDAGPVYDVASDAFYAASNDAVIAFARLIVQRDPLHAYAWLYMVMYLVVLDDVTVASAARTSSVGALVGDLRMSGHCDAVGDAAITACGPVFAKRVPKRNAFMLHRVDGDWQRPKITLGMLPGVYAFISRWGPERYYDDTPATKGLFAVLL